MPVPGDILVVDDTMTALMMLVALLSTQGYQVSSAQSGAEALDLVQKHPPDLILLDFNMPDMDGLAVCRELKQSPRTRDIPVLFLSSVSDSQTKVDGFDAGAVDFIIKPFERSELLARVNTHLDLARLKKRLSKLVEEKTESLRLSEQRFRALIEQAPEAILVYNLDSGRFVDANQQAEKLTGRTLQALVGTSPTSLYATEQPDGLPVAESVTLHAERAQKGEIAPFERILQRPDGSTIPCEVRLSKLPSETDHLLRVSYIDISSRVAAQEKINRLAYFDTLTGLHNESGLLEQLNALFAIAGGRHPFAALLVDLGDFKFINDVYGNRIGDLLLRHVAQRLRQTLGTRGHAARLGGVEFAAILTSVADAAEAETIAGQVLDAISEPFPVDEMMLSLTASVGVSLGPAHGADGQELLTRADMALYQAKQRGTRRIQVYEEELGRQMRERVELEKSLRHAIDHGELVLHYQPQVELSTGRVVGVEALVRWQHPKKGMIPPMQFIPIAEQSGLILPLGRWVLREACRQLRAWQDKGGAELRMAVNLSVAQFTDHELPDFVADVLKETGVAARHLELEITESCTMLSPQQSITMMEQFRAMGIHSSIDDFGTGHSALAYLTRFPVDTLKIDQSFIRNINNDEKGSALCDTIAYLAHRMGLQVVAEGVETQQQLTFLTSIHVDVVQGYLLCKPLPAAEVEDFILRQADTKPLPGVEYF
ncbi:EAL domain-containing protein [Chromobacterium piscinae]|uniref:two-component system response regulator n=1 Tax=Chromobacterium piscinae TaxID=686831 RepID=UPI001E40DE22|nr:EAL domain-containing protein [Chromobacterium piscinae]MCD5329707.1 EAL domain-containing protein [Chromobacterium piscinae]